MTKRLKIACIVGARPNFIKMMPIIREMRGRPGFEAHLVHTGQHFSPEMSDIFFKELELSHPDVNLDVGGGTQTYQTAEIMRRLESSFEQTSPDLVLVVGDVNSTLAAALVAAKMGIPIAHVEAGLRSFDRRMPEEINRLVTDTLSDFLFTTEPSAERNLLAEGVPRNRTFAVGNVMIDTLLRFRSRAAQTDVLERLDLQPKSYAVVTLHRPSNVDDLPRLTALFTALQQIATRIPVVFPVHPRTSAKLAAAQISSDGLILVPPLGYLEFLRLMSEARLVLTDSGGIQEETTILQVPCLTLRENTERPITIESGTNRLVGVQPESILRAAYEALEQGGSCPAAPPLWDGLASQRIVDVLEKQMGAPDPSYASLSVTSR